MSRDIHKHELGEQLSKFFVSKINSDQTEGRGAMRDYGVFTDHDAAYQKVKGQGVQGCGDGDVYIRSYYRCTGCPEIVQKDERIYLGSEWLRKNALPSEFAADGWRVDFSPLANDPEYAEYIRLKAKFEA